MRKKDLKKSYMTPAFCKTTTQKALKNLADELRTKSLYHEAVKNYLELIMLDNNNVSVNLGLGICYKKLNKLDKAIKYLEKATTLDFNNFEIFYELGICHLLNETPCKAIKCFIQAIQIEPENPDAIYQLGIAHEMCDENDMALMIYQKLIENSPNYINSYLRKALIYKSLGFYDKALDLYLKANKIDKTMIKIYSEIGYCLEKIGKMPDAKRYYRKFISLSPADNSVDFIKRRMEKLREIPRAKVKLSIV